MSVRILLQKVIVSIVLLGLVTIQVAVPVVSASEEIDGSVRTFGFNNPTTISNVVITDNAGELIDSGIGTADLTRTSDFIIEFDVFDLDGFDHLDVYVALFNTNSSSAFTLRSSALNDNGVMLATFMYVFTPRVFFTTDVTLSSSKSTN